jgi:WD40 repeat protein/beta-lactamase regulating signal transducer with metallopeptidase domain
LIVGLVGWLNAWGAAWAAFMVRALVDSSLLLAILLVVWLPLRRAMSAQLAYGLFLLVLLKLAIPVSALGLPGTRLQREERPAPAAGPNTAEAPTPGFPATGDLGVMTADQPAPEPRARVITAGAPDAVGETARVRSPVNAAGPVARQSLTLEAALMLGWSLVAAVLLARLVRAMWSTGRLVRQARPLAPASLSVDLEELRRASRIRRQVGWATSARLHSPAVGGLIWPTVVLPPGLDTELTPRQLSWVLLHELAHIRRLDLWVVVIQRLAQAVFFFHPAVHVANWIIDQLREYACDDAAMVATRSSRRDCGEGFLVIVERQVERPVPLSPSLGLFESKSLIRRRLARILDPRRKVEGRLSPLSALALLAVALLVLPTGWGHAAAVRLLAPARSGPGPARGHSTLPLGDRGGAAEPTNYRPGEVLLRRTAAARDGVVALGYSPDGATLAMVGEDTVVILRELATGRVRARLEGHRDAVACLAYAPDGQTIATGGYDRTVRLWDAGDGRPRAVLAGHSNWVVALAHSPDGKLIASAGYDRTIRLWDAASGRPLAALAGHRSAVRCLAFSLDGRWLASGGADRVAIVWDLQSRGPRLHLAGHEGTIRSVAVSPDGTLLATAGEDAVVKLWDMTTGSEQATLTGHSDMVSAAGFSPAGHTLATASLDTTVKLWDVATWHERATLQGHADGVAALAFAPRGRQLATGSYDGSVRLWEPAAPLFVPTACFEGPAAVESLAFENNGLAVLAVGRSGILARWDVRTGDVLAGNEITAGSIFAAPERKTVEATATPDSTVHVTETATGIERFAVRAEGLGTVAVSPDGAVLATGHSAGDIVLWDSRDGREVAVLKGHRDAIKAIAFAPDGRSLATLDAGRAVKLWSLEVRRVTPAATLRLDPQICLVALAYSPDGATLAVADGPANAAGGVALWDLATRRLRAALEGHERGVAAVAFSPDGATLASADWSGVVRLWDAATGRPRDAFGGPQRVLRLVFSPDGAVLAAAGADRSVTLWDLESGSELARFTCPGGRLHLAFSPDGRRLAVSGGDTEPGPGVQDEVTIWDVATRSRAASLSGHNRAIIALAFAPDGATLATSGLDRAVRIWDLATGRTRRALAGLPCPAQSLAFSPDGRVLALAGRDDAIVALHDTQTGALVGRLIGHCGPVRDVSFSPDGRSLATAGSDRAIKLWDLSAVHAGTSARAGVSRNSIP